MTDEFPFLVRASPSLPSVIQRELGPGGAGQGSMARLLLCGSAMSVMGKLLSGSAPLRGRASLELIVHPFGYRDAARFWGADDPRLAVLLHSIVGGTPAYRREFVAFDAPQGPGDFDSWVRRTVLSSQSPLFREARYLLAEEAEIREPALYHSVLGAIAAGNRTNGGIANFIGRKSADLTHPLNVLEDCGLVAKEPDVFRRGRWTYRVTEPLVNFYEAIMRPEWSRLESGEAQAVWRDRQAGFLSRVVGPHFETLCRLFARDTAAGLFGGPAGEVGSGIVNDPASRTKWGEVMTRAHAERLARARDLLSPAFDTADCVLACYSAAGFSDDLRAAEVHQHFNDWLAAAGAFLEGRVTHELMAGFWPTADQDPEASPQMAEFAGIWREMPKIVYSKTLDRAGWNTEIRRDVDPDEIRAMKEQPGGDLALGGADLAATFSRLGLIDEYRIYVHPVLAGAGRRLFDPAYARTLLTLTETRTFGNGVVLLRYAANPG